MKNKMGKDVAVTAMIIVELISNELSGTDISKWYYGDGPGGINDRRDCVFDVAQTIHRWLDKHPDFHERVDGCWDLEILPEVLREGAEAAMSDWNWCFAYTSTVIKRLESILASTHECDEHVNRSDYENQS